MILWVSKNGEGLPIARHMHRHGAPVVVFIGDAFYREKRLYDGLLPQVATLEAGLKCRPECVIFDSSAMGDLADGIGKYLPVWGGSAIADAMEQDRGFGIELMARCGIRIPRTVIFDPLRGEDGLPDAQVPFSRVRGHLEEAIAFVRREKARWIIKPYASGGSAGTYVSHDPNDMVEYLQHLLEQRTLPLLEPFLLQEWKDGVEVSTEVWLRHGEIVPGSWSGTIERKKFMAGDLGPATGASTSVVWAYQKEPKILEYTFPPAFRAWLRRPEGPDGRVHPPLHGPCDLNVIVSDAEPHIPYGLEFTVRFGYGAYFALAEVLGEGWHTILPAAAQGTLAHLPTKAGFGYACRVTVPPYPVDDEISHEKKPDLYRDIMEIGTGVDLGGPTDSEHVWLIDARMKNGNLETAGTDGIVCECSGHGATIEAACDQAEALVKDLVIANKQARLLDGADRARHDGPVLRAWGYDFPGAG